ncbi:MAG: hypothetical protein AAF703_23050 [Cyanobacteria bacterium P01_D01_bin.105]
MVMENEQRKAGAQANQMGSQLGSGVRDALGEMLRGIVRRFKAWREMRLRRQDEVVTVAEALLEKGNRIVQRADQSLAPQTAMADRQQTVDAFFVLDQVDATLSSKHFKDAEVEQVQETVTEASLLSDRPEVATQDAENEVLLKSELTPEQRLIIDVSEAFMGDSKSPQKATMDSTDLSAGMVYRAEDFIISRIGNQVTISDKSNNVLFQYVREGGALSVRVDKLTQHKEHYAAFAHARSSIQAHGLKEIRSDYTSRFQVEKLQGLAQEGAYGAALASCLVNDQSPIKRIADEQGMLYEFSKYSEGDLNGYRVKQLGRVDAQGVMQPQDRVPLEQQVLIETNRGKISVIAGGLSAEQTAMLRHNYAAARQRIVEQVAQFRATQPQSTAEKGGR